MLNLTSTEITLEFNVHRNNMVLNLTCTEVTLSLTSTEITLYLTSTEAVSLIKDGERDGEEGKT